MEYKYPSNDKMIEKNVTDGGTEYSEYELPMKKSADGSRTYVPENHEPLNAPSGMKRSSKSSNLTPLKF